MTDTVPSPNTKQQIAVFLPAALKKAIQSYEAYYVAIDHEDNKQFSEYHKNAKVALAHIELLLKLAKWADVKDDTIERAMQHYGSGALDEVNFYHDTDTSET